MDINGFMLRVREAMADENPEEATTLYNVKSIPISAMQKAFKTHESWNDLNDENSDFVKFLKTECSYEDTQNISIQKMRCVGILWCKGNAIEKATELYEIMQDGGQPTIPCNDKDFKPNFNHLIYYATEMLFKKENVGTL